MKPAYLALTSIAIILIACRMAKPHAQPRQGISGYIYEVRSNQMPSPGRIQSKGRGIKRDIYIYQPTTAAQAIGTSPLFSAIKTKLVAHTQSDSTGRYEVNLPAGQYSVFIAEGGKFFASITDNGGLLNPVNVKVNTIAHKDIMITINAVY